MPQSFEAGLVEGEELLELDVLGAEAFGQVCEDALLLSARGDVPERTNGIALDGVPAPGHCCCSEKARFGVRCGTAGAEWSKQKSRLYPRTQEKAIRRRPRKTAGRFEVEVAVSRDRVTSPEHHRAMKATLEGQL